MRRLLFTLTGLALLGAGLAPTASANTLQATCSTFGSQLTAAGTGDTIVLTGLCTAPTASFTLPATPNLTIQGAASGINGFDGTGAGSPALASPAGGTSGITIQGLAFQKYSASRAVTLSQPITASAANLSNPYSFLDDNFSNNSNPSGDGGALLVDLSTGTSGSCTLSGPTLTIAGSSFSNNSAPGLNFLSAGVEGGGGGAVVDLECHAGTPVVDLSNNNFSNNTVIAPLNNNRQGGGLFIGAGFRHQFSVPLSLNQSGNVFSGNAVIGTGGSYAGGGEHTVGANVTSSGDRFTSNTLPGPTASGKSSEGAGLSTRGGGNCTTSSGATSQAVNLVAAGNAIGSPSGGGAAGEGSGIYAGCSISTGGYHLTLINSTVSGNQAPGGGVPGIDGEATDFLDLQNTIANGNAGGQDIGGFGASDGANVTAAGSDVCAIGSSTDPFTGAGNICASPALVDPGPGAGNVHETDASPTIDAGSNAFVSVPTDVFGNPRILVGRTGDDPIVDIGAAEFGPAPNPTPGLPDNSFTVGKVKGKVLFVTVASAGAVKVIQASATGRNASASKAKRLLKPSSASGGPGTVKVRLRLTAAAARTLRRTGKLKIKAQVTFTPTGGTPNSKRATRRLKKPHRR